MPFSDATTISEILTPWNGPNFHGILHKSSPEETPFKTLVMGAQGGIGNGAVTANHREFEWQFDDLRNPSTARVRVDGFKSLSAENRRRFNVKNVIQTHTESFEVAVEKQAQTGEFAGINANQGENPVQDELGYQGRAALTQVNLDQEVSLLYQTYHLPSDNTTPARTRGIDEAIVTNRVDANGAPLSWALLTKAAKAAVEVAGKMIGEGLVVMVNTDALEQISVEFKSEGLAPRDRTVYGVNVTTVISPFGPLNLLYNRHVNQGQAIGVNPKHLRSWHRFVPPHGPFPGGVTYLYDVATVGNATERAIYSSIGLEYGLEKAHFSIDNLETESAS